MSTFEERMNEIDISETHWQDYIAKKLEDDVYLIMEVSDVNLTELAKVRGYPATVVDWVDEELTIKVTR